ncbi:MAG: hypothetical protein IKV07_00010 [Bacteroidaceae bacterium]|nr:hypothetical protein [Bacteroidaceae bacterium]
MKNIVKIFVVIFSSIACGTFVCSCNESYISPDYVVPADTIPYNPVLEYVPVIMSMSDPAYVTLSRGIGPIAADRPNIKNEAVFYVYSFLTNNYAYSDGADFRKTFVTEDKLEADEPMYCLIDDPATGLGAPAMLMDNEVLDFLNYESTYYYSQRFQEYKYNFFAYHIDNAKINGGVVREQDNIHMNITIDGTQDIITAVAHLEDKQLTEIDPNEEKWLFSNVLNRELVFSTLTGHRFIIPVFKAKHNLARFTFNLIGEDALSDSIYIQDIYVMAHRDWDLTVAADDSTKVGIAMHGERERLEEVHLCDEIGEVDGSTTNLEQYTYRVKQNELLSNLGLGMLLPARTIYDLYIKCAYQTPDGKERRYTAHYALTNRVIAADGSIINNPFEPGRQYNVTMHVYGYQQIQLSMDGLDWGEPIEIIIDEEDMFDFEEE